MKGQGIRIGAYLSGLVGNMALDEVDHIMVQKYGAVIHRHCDDVRILAKSKAEARFLLSEYDRLCGERGLTVKHGSGYRPIPDEGKDGLDFLGYVFTRSNVRLRKSIKTKFASGIRRVKSARRRKELSAAYKGWCGHGHGRNLYRKVMGFAARGIDTEIKTKDGKKYFDAPMRRINDVINVPLDVLDFESDIPTRDLREKDRRNNDRYVVLVRTREGERLKFITNAYPIKEVLDKCREAEKEGRQVFPVENVCVKRKDIGGGKSTYGFIDL